MARCCEFDRRNAVIGVLSVLLLIAAVGWWREATKQPVTVPQVEMIDVPVAVRELVVGTAFGKHVVDELVTMKPFPKDSLPRSAITTKDDLIGKRLHRIARQGEMFTNADVHAKVFIQFDHSMDIMSLPLGYRQIAIGDRVDLIASHGEDTKRESFMLLPDLTVLQISPEWVVCPKTDEVSFAVDEKQAKLVALALQRNCKIEFVPQQANAPKPDWDYTKTFARLKTLGEPELPVAPPPRELRIVQVPRSVVGTRGFVGPGARVDIVGSHLEGDRREVFTLLADLTVFAVNGEQQLGGSTFPDVEMLSFAVNEKKARLIELAMKANCNLEFLLRHHDARPRYPTQQAEDEAYDKMFALVAGWLKEQEPHVAPPPRAIER